MPKLGDTMTNTDARPIVIRPLPEIEALAKAILESAGCAPATATAAAEVFVEADLRGVGLQGLDYLPLMVRALQSGRIDSRAEPIVAVDRPSALLVDGRRGVGQYAAQVAIDWGLAKARETGACAVGLVDASEIYMLGFYAERIARGGCVGFAFSTWAPLVHPWGGMEKILGTNPISIAAPRRGAPPMVVDLATSALANGRVRQAAYHDEDVPAGVGLGPDGLPTTVAAEIQRGAISPLAGAKGYGLSLAVAILCGPLIGADVGKGLATLKGGGPSKARLGHFFIILDPNAFGEQNAYLDALEGFFHELQSSPAAPGHDGVRLPGDRAFAARERAVRDGVPILQATWDIIIGLAAELGAATPAACD